MSSCRPIGDDPASLHSTLAHTRTAGLRKHTISRGLGNHPGKCGQDIYLKHSRCMIFCQIAHPLLISATILVSTRTNNKTFLLNTLRIWVFRSEKKHAASLPRTIKRICTDVGRVRCIKCAPMKSHTRCDLLCLHFSLIFILSFFLHIVCHSSALFQNAGNKKIKKRSECFHQEKITKHMLSSQGVRTCGQFCQHR